MPLVPLDVDLDASSSFHMTEEVKVKAEELRNGGHHQPMKETQRDLERAREKERIRAGKELLEAKRNAEENARKRMIDLKQLEKEERRARQRIRQKLEADKDDDAKLKRAFQTLYIYVRNVMKNPDFEKFRKIRVTNPVFQGDQPPKGDKVLTSQDGMQRATEFMHSLINGTFSGGVILEKIARPLSSDKLEPKRHL